MYSNLQVSTWNIINFPQPYFSDWTFTIFMSSMFICLLQPKSHSHKTLKPSNLSKSISHLSKITIKNSLYFLPFFFSVELNVFISIWLIELLCIRSLSLSPLLSGGFFMCLYNVQFYYLHIALAYNVGIYPEKWKAIITIACSESLFYIFFMPFQPPTINIISTHKSRLFFFNICIKDL